MSLNSKDLQDVYMPTKAQLKSKNKKKETDQSDQDPHTIHDKNVITDTDIYDS